MRVLTVGNMYPPHHLGGYELIWAGAVEHLRSAGHQVRVLTTNHRLAEPDPTAAPDVDVHRELRWYWREHRFPFLSPRTRMAVERHNGAVLERHLDELRPDVVSWWAMGGMSLSLVERVRRRGIPAAALVADDWLLYAPWVDAWMRPWRRVPRAAGLVERLTGLPARFDTTAVARWTFISETVRARARNAGWSLPGSEVVHPGIDPGRFAPAEPRPWRWRLLYAGRIDVRKGIDTAIRALARLPPEATLTVDGAGHDALLEALRDLAHTSGVAARVTFQRTPRAQLPAAYADADAVLFPVAWDEPWGLVPLEAMAVGRPVVATGLGGSAEYLRDGENCLLFAPHDDPGLAAALRRLAAEPELVARLRTGGAQTAAAYTEERFHSAVAAALTSIAA